jgi:hypothetical protein
VIEKRDAPSTTVIEERNEPTIVASGRNDRKRGLHDDHQAEDGRIR